MFDGFSFNQIEEYFVQNNIQFSYVESNGDTGKMRFSKSWRQLSGLLNTSMLPGKECVDEIVVFGHSLGNQDYSYFHSLFNFYEIYSSRVKLTFLYAAYVINPKTRMPDIIKTMKTESTIQTLFINY